METLVIRLQGPVVNNSLQPLDSFRFTLTNNNDSKIYGIVRYLCKDSKINTYLKRLDENSSFYYGDNEQSLTPISEKQVMVYSSNEMMYHFESKKPLYFRINNGKSSNFELGRAKNIQGFGKVYSDWSYNTPSDTFTLSFDIKQLLNAPNFCKLRRGTQINNVGSKLNYLTLLNNVESVCGVYKEIDNDVDSILLNDFLTSSKEFSFVGFSNFYRKDGTVIPQTFELGKIDLRHINTTYNTTGLTVVYNGDTSTNPIIPSGASRVIGYVQIYNTDNVNFDNFFIALDNTSDSVEYIEIKNVTITEASKEAINSLKEKCSNILINGKSY